MDKPLLFGHHRSGNHYLAALLNENFYHFDEYLSLLQSSQHALARGIIPNRKYLYIHRNFTDVSKSVFAMRARLGLDVDSYEKFLATRYRDMYTGKIAVLMHMNFINRQGTSRSNSIFFHGIKSTPEEWHTRHIDHYKQLFEGKDNCLMVDYDKLKSDFIKEMVVIAKFLGFPDVSLRNINEKVGWWPVPIPKPKSGRTRRGNRRES